LLINILMMAYFYREYFIFVIIFLIKTPCLCQHLDFMPLNNL
jgi:hypothetical protein